MAYSRTTNLGFFKFGDNEINWHHFYNYNLEVLEENIKLVALADVDVTKLKDKSIIKYNDITQRWEVVYEREVA